MNLNLVCRRPGRQKPRAVTRLLALACLVMPAAAYADTLTCESHNNNRAVCRANTYGGVTLMTQLSSASCRQGSTWGYDSRHIWVSNGCRAVFRVGSDEHRNDHDSDNAAAAVAGLALLAVGAAAVHNSHRHDREQRYEDHYDYRYDDSRDDYYDRYDRRQVEVVTCSSDNNRHNYCRTRIHNGHVRLVRQHSKSECRHHEDWGYNRSGIWVDNGCRATFEVER